MENKDGKTGAIRANVIAAVSELLIAVLYLAIGFNAITSAVENMNFANMFDGIITAICFLNIAILALALVCLLVKPMRTKYTVRMSIWNIIWILGNVYLMYA